MADILAAAFASSAEFDTPQVVAPPKPQKTKGKRKAADDNGPRKREKVEAGAAATTTTTTTEGSDDVVPPVSIVGSLEKKERKRGQRRQKKGLNEDPEKQARTLFLGNVPLSLTVNSLKRKLKTLLSPAQKEDPGIESIRLRSVPIQGIATKPGASYKDMRKAAAINRSFDATRQTCNAYVVFTTKEKAEAGLALNGKVLEGFHLRADRETGSKNKHDHKRSVFVGQLPFVLEEDELRSHFTSLLPPRSSAGIVSVRLIRDKATNTGKGIGYVTFKEPIHVLDALKLDQSEMKGRKISVKRCLPDKKQKKSVENAPGANFRGVKGADAASGKTVGKLLKKTGKPGATKPSKSAKLKAKAKKVVKKQRKQTKKAAAK